MEYTQTLHGHILSSKLNLLKDIELVVFDVDGTLTDGGIYLDNSGLEFKRFYAKDGLGIGLLSHFNIATAIITGRHSKLVERRAQELDIKYVMQGISQKDIALKEIKQKINLQGKCLCVGDDLNDLPMLEKADVKAAPQDANTYVKSICDIVLNAKAGHGAVRELCDLILIAKGNMTLEGALLNTDKYKCSRQ